MEDPPTSSTQAASPQAHGITFQQAVRVWIKVACLSFGGPAGQIAVMHRILVDEKRWISENRFLHALNYCMLLPGPEAQQLATYMGWLMHGTLGGLVAGTLFILPGFTAILLLSYLYAEYQDLTLVAALFFGLKPAVVAIVVEAVVRIGRRALKNQWLYGLAALAFIGIFFLGIPFPLILLSAALVGFIGGKFRPDLFVAGGAHGPAGASTSEPLIPDHHSPTVGPPLRRSLLTLAVWLTLWLVPLGLLIGSLGSDHVLSKVGVFFSQMALVTFGGAYAVLSYVAQQAVENFGWLAPGEMLDGLGLAETTPGPLIMVVEFVGFLAAYRNPAPFQPWTAGVFGAVISTWVTFTPCFLWIFLGAPYIESLRGVKSLTHALTGITAAVVGVILNLAVWFAIHTLFGEVRELEWSGLSLSVPVLESIQWPMVGLAALAFLSLFRWKLGMMATLAISVCAGATLYQLIYA